MELAGRSQFPDDGYPIPEWVEGILRSLPPESRMRLPPRSTLVARARLALEHALADGSLPTSARKFVEGQVAEMAFEALFDPARPLDDAWVVGQATAIAQWILRLRDREFHPRYGEVVEPAAAMAIGGFGLVELGRQISRGSEIERRRAYLRRIIAGDVGEMIDAAMRASSPGARAYRALVKRNVKALGKTRTDLEQLDLHALAAREADRKLKLLGGLLSRAAEREGDSIADPGQDVCQEVFDRQLIELFDGLVAKPPFTTTDADTWRRFKAADLCGRHIDWGEACGRHAGAQRLHALFAKIRGLLEDWRP
jgi:hypothetical protein